MGIEREKDLGAVVVHETPDYLVVINDDITMNFQGNEYYGGYEVLNKTTGITEFMQPQLPECIFVAEALQHAMEAKSWEWRKTDAAGEAVQASATDILQ